MRVVSRGTSFAAAGLYAEPREVAGALGADVMLEGSVRRMGDALHLTAALVDGQTGENLWADKYEGDSGDIFRFQREVLERLVTTLMPISVPGNWRTAISATKITPPSAS